MARLLPLAVLSVVVAGVLAGVVARSAHGDYTLAAAYGAGIISRDYLAGFGCTPAVFGGIACSPTDAPWCQDHPPPNPDLLGQIMFDGRLARKFEPRECQVSPYELGIITGVRIVGPDLIPRPYLR